MDIDPPLRKRKKSIQFDLLENKHFFFRRKKTRRLIHGRILRILYQGVVHEVSWSLDSTEDEMDQLIRKGCGLLPADKQAYDLYNEQGHKVPLDKKRFPEDCNLELSLLTVPKQGYTMEETCTWKHLTNKIAQNVSCFSSVLCEMIAEYAHPSMYFVGNKVDMRCKTDGCWWISTILRKTETTVLVSVDGWHPTLYTQEHPMNGLYPPDSKLKPLMPVGTFTGEIGEIAAKRFLLPWNCTHCNVWNASHLIQCSTQNCVNFRPFYEPCWCAYKFTDKQFCIQAHWTCECGFINEPYCNHCMNCHAYGSRRRLPSNCFSRMIEFNSLHANHCCYY